MRSLSRISIIPVILLTVCLVSPAQTAPVIPEALQRAPALNPNLTLFPESAFIDRTSTLDAPAGKHGFVTVQNGHFAYTTGTRVRFFGINLAKDTVFVSKPTIDRLCNLFARAGINLVRIHHIDDTQGILDPNPDHYFRAEKLDLIDYWIARLKERGIYICLDLNDYRTFRTSDGVIAGESLGRGAKPYAVFDQRLIELQQEYAAQFLVNHVNPYTRLPYAHDPAVAFLEIYDENGLFIRRGDWENLSEPYKSNLTKRWNAWLTGRYQTTEGLRAAWTNGKGFCALAPGESLEQGNVRLPRMSINHTLPDAPEDLLRAPARISDGAQFAYEVQTGYLSTMMTYLRKIGVKVPVTAVGAQDIVPDTLATASTTDYIGINYYWDHPSWAPGKEWTQPAYFNLLNPIMQNLDYTFPATVSLARMLDKPLVVRELGYCYPNPYRGVGMLEAAAYGAFLDVDALILFTYDANSQVRTIGYFDIHLDPLRWGMVSQASRLFLSNAIQPARYTIGLGYSPVDAFTWYAYQNALYRLGFVSRMVHYTDLTRPNPFDLLVASGRSCGGVWQGEHLLLFANQTHADLRYQVKAEGLDMLAGYRVKTVNGGIFNFTFHGVGFNAGTVQRLQSWPAFSAEDVMAKGFFPVATNNSLAKGFIDPKRKNIIFRNLRPEVAVRVAIDALRDWYNAPISHTDLDRGFWRTDTGQIERNTGDGLLKINTPSMQAVAGMLGSKGPIGVGAVQVTTSTPIGALVVESLDGQPLNSAAQVLVKMTSKARNAHTMITPGNEGPKPHRLTSIGIPPILTDGQATTTPTRVELAGKLLLELGLRNGTWEYLLESDRALLYLDTGEIPVKFPQIPKQVRWYTDNETIDVTPAGDTVMIPTGVRYTEVIW
ncbi:MAG: hypothetical protein ACYC7E_02085 [Armatimonadota bacterium]